VYRFTSRDVATVAIQLGNKALFISSVYLDITKIVRSPELISLLDWCRSQSTPLVIGMDCNSHSYLYSDMENNRGIERENVVSEYRLEIHNSCLVPTFAGAGPNGTVNNSIIDMTLGMNLPVGFKIKEWKVSGLPSGSDHRNITYTYESTRSEKESTKMGRNYHRADWKKFRSLVNTSKMTAIANGRRWTPLIIELATDRWYSSVNIAFNQVCKPSKIKITGGARIVSLQKENTKIKRSMPTEEVNHRLQTL
jgi:hypothetical protein